MGSSRRATGHRAQRRTLGRAGADAGQADVSDGPRDQRGTKKPAGIAPSRRSYTDGQALAQQLILRRTHLWDNAKYRNRSRCQALKSSRRFSSRRARFKHLFDARECAYRSPAVGRSGGLRSQGGVQLPTGGNALPFSGTGRARGRLVQTRDEQTRCDPGADGHSPVMRTVVFARWRDSARRASAASP